MQKPVLFIKKDKPVLKNERLSFIIKLKNKKRSVAIGTGHGKTCRLSRA